MKSQSKLARKKRPAKHEKTMEYILGALKHFKKKQYELVNNELYNVRTNDLREMLKDLGPNHRYYNVILQILNDPKIECCHSEALYNMAVILSEKPNVAPLLELGALDTVLKYIGSSDPKILHRCLWCVFGFSASSIESRQACLGKGVLQLALKFLLMGKDKIQDLAGQIVYGIFHMQPLPTEDESFILFDYGKDILEMKSSAIKYYLWAVHFAEVAYANRIIECGLLDPVLSHLSSSDPSVLVPGLILISGLLKAGARIPVEKVDSFSAPLGHTDMNVRVQTCRTVADYINDGSAIDALQSSGIYATVIRIALEDDPRAKEQAAYAIIRGFGLGTREQRRSLAEIGGLRAILLFTTEAAYPFNTNLIDCMAALLDFDYEFFAKLLREYDSINVLYKLLTVSDSSVSSKAANLIGLIGEK